MEHAEIINLWKAYDRKLEENLVLNRQNAADMIKVKIKSNLASMKPAKKFTLILGIVWVVLGFALVTFLSVFAFSQVSKFFLFSAIVQLLLTTIAIVVYAYQLVLIQKVDITAPILKTQEHLARLRASTLWVTRVLFLQLPVWTTFYWSEKMLAQATMSVLVLLGGITLLFVYAALWLFLNIRYENRNKKWFRLIFQGKEWTPLEKSIDLLDQVKEYKDEAGD
ncbi:MAG TPA: hypothetical protein VK826_16495 [Bacteroidia bacterium]|nr:hypothetical protein [Bacteroidia bacterium]